MSIHDEVANRIATKFDTFYNRGYGPDIFNRKIVIEVVLANTIKNAFELLKGWEKPVYMAGATQLAIKKAIEAVKGTNIGVMDQNGKIIKRSTR